MKANNKRKVFGDAVDLLMDEIEEREGPRGVQLLQIKNIQPFHDHILLLMLSMTRMFFHSVWTISKLWMPIRI